jgi:hypothetical protein
MPRMSTFHTGSGHAGIDFSTPASGAVGSMTKSVYDASSSTALSMHKLHGRFMDLLKQLTGYSNSSQAQCHEVTTSLERSVRKLETAMRKLSHITNGVDKAYSDKVLDSALSSIEKSTRALILGIHQKNMLKQLIHSDSTRLSSSVRDILSDVTDSLSVLSVSDRETANAKIMGSMPSLSLPERLESAHLAKAAPAVHEGVQLLHKIAQDVKSFGSLQQISPENVVPVAAEQKLEKAFTYDRSAVDHIKLAKSLGDRAKLREVIDARIRLRHAMKEVQDFVSGLGTINSELIGKSIVKRNTEMATKVQSSLLPEVGKFGGIRDQIVGEIDKNHSLETISNLERQLKAHESSIPSFFLIMDRSRYINFL